jgi:hypothetical protein
MKRAVYETRMPLCEHARLLVSYHGSAAKALSRVEKAYRRGTDVNDRPFHEAEIERQRDLIRLLGGRPENP